MRLRIGKTGELETSVQLSILRFMKFKGFYGGKTRTMGVKRGKSFCFDPFTFTGFPDLTFFGEVFGDYRLIFIEVKASKGVQSDKQKEFQRCCEAAGVKYILARSVEDVERELTQK